MEISPYSLFLMLVYSFLLGLGLGLLYDVFRIVRVMTGRLEIYDSTPARGKRETIRLPMPPLVRDIFGRRVLPIGLAQKGNGKIHKILMGIWLFFEDILFFTIAGTAVALLMYYTNDGQFRLMALAVAAFGFVTYYLTLGKLVLAFSQAVSFFVRSALTYCIFVSLTPVAYILKGIKKLASVTFGRIFKRIAEVRADKRDAVVMKEIYLFIGSKPPENRNIKLKTKEKTNAKRREKNIKAY